MKTGPIAGYGVLSNVHGDAYLSMPRTRLAPRALKISKNHLYTSRTQRWRLPALRARMGFARGHGSGRRAMPFGPMADRWKAAGRASGRTSGCKAGRTDRTVTRSFSRNISASEENRGGLSPGQYQGTWSQFAIRTARQGLRSLNPGFAHPQAVPTAREPAAPTPRSGV